MIEQLYTIYKTAKVICTDTRKITKGGIFFALKGDRFNANEFAEKALEEGCAYAVIDDMAFKKDKRYLVVDDVLLTLQELANYHRRQLKIPIIGITGTNGKTTTKELMNAVLSAKYKVIATKGNLNNHIGVPLTLLTITEETEIAIIEMGANHPKEIKFLAEIAMPNLGLITNIGMGHLEGFGSFEGVKNTKKELYDYLRNTNGKVFINSSNPVLNEISEGLDKINYGIKGDESITGRVENNGLFISVNWINNKTKSTNLINTAIVGAYNLENILAAITVGTYFGIEDIKMNDAIAAYHPENSRSQVLTTSKNTIILDAYNANPPSMNNALDNFSKLIADKKIAILGDMLELGNYSIDEHQRIYDKIKSLDLELSIFVGKQFHSIVKPEVHHLVFLTVNDLNDYLKEHPILGATILIKGSRGIRLEQSLENL